MLTLDEHTVEIILASSVQCLDAKKVQPWDTSMDEDQNQLVQNHLF